ncbi:MAG: sulfatase-like hydrolase/transferase [Planctomycetaceae bacterium]
MHYLELFLPLRLRLGGLAIVGLLIGAANAHDASGEEAFRPNIVILVSDDLDYGKLGYNGYSAVATPHLDSVIRGGTFFSNGYVSGPVCAPTRAGLMTGRYQARIGYQTLTGPIERQIADDYGVDTREILLPQLLKDAGYATAVIGKWHLGYNDKYHPNERGVDHFFGFLAGGHDYFLWDTPEVSPQGGAILRNKQKAAGEGYVTEALAREAAEFVRNHRDGPFFLYYSPYNVHAPHVVPDRYLPEDGDVMAGMVRALDDSVGVILAALDACGLTDDTLIVYVNDNGGTRDNSPYRGKKGQLYEGGIRVPFAMRWPGRIPAGATFDPPVIQLDILPTVVTAAGGTLPGDREFDGVNLLPFLTSDDLRAPHEELFWRYPGHGRAVRAGNLKLLLPEQDGPQLYDLNTDPGEQDDITLQFPMKVARLRKAVQIWEARVADPQQYGLSSR